MEQDPTTPQDNAENSKKNIGGADLEKILLPKKDPVPGGSLDSASRVNAGALLAQETSAELPPQQTTAPVAREIPPLQKQEEESIVKPLETYQGDIEKLVHQKNVSVVSIAAAEAARRAAQPVAPAPAPRSIMKPLAQMGGRLVMILGGVSLLALSVGIFFLLYLRSQPVSVLQEDTTAPFILVDGTQPIVFEEGTITRAALMGNLETEHQSLSIPLGLMARLFVAQASTTQGEKIVVPVDAQKILSTLSTGIPQELLRTILPEYLLGVHSYDGNQAFIILGIDSYQQAFSGMLKWEPQMQRDLAPLFTRTPRPRTPEELAAAPSTSTPQLVNNGFVDAVVENFDTRAVRDNNGDILLLWTFLDRNTIVITTNEYSLREILSRIAHTPGTIKE